MYANSVTIISEQCVSDYTEFKITSTTSTVNVSLVDLLEIGREPDIMVNEQEKENLMTEKPKELSNTENEQISFQGATYDSAAVVEQVHEKLSSLANKQEANEPEINKSKSLECVIQLPQNQEKTTLRTVFGDPAINGRVNCNVCGEEEKVQAINLEVEQKKPDSPGPVDRRRWPPNSRSGKLIGGIRNFFRNINIKNEENKRKRRSTLASILEENWEIPCEGISDLMFIGSGSQGMVYRGKMENEIVAVKKVGKLDDTEIKHLKELKHDNVVRFKGICSQNLYFIIMEYCPFGSLYDLIKNETIISSKRFVNWSRQVASGMNYLHCNEIIHRDLKSPKNRY